MNWQVVQLKDVTPTPWRNGGGTTRELLAWPNAQRWQWRVSVADVVQSGAFSSFVGVKRWFAVLEGDGVCLTVQSDKHTLLKDSIPLAFDGAAQTHCELIGGATQDFNLMVQAAGAARMWRVHDDFEIITNAPKTVAVYAHNTQAIVQIGNKKQVLLPRSFGWATVDADTAIRVDGRDALLMEIGI